MESMIDAKRRLEQEVEVALTGSHHQVTQLSFQHYWIRWDHQEPSNPIPGDVGGLSDGECSSAHSEPCCCEMEDNGDDEVVDWDVTHSPFASCSQL